jgi:hypothetical protein
VRTGPDGLPAAVRVPSALSGEGAATTRRRGATAGRRAPEGRAGWATVLEIEDVWKINDEWWRGEDQRIERLYFAVVLDNGHRMTLFSDLARGCWRRQSD